MTPDDLLADLRRQIRAYPPGSFALSCGNNRLTAVEICLSKDLRPKLARECVPAGRTWSR